MATDAETTKASGNRLTLLAALIALSFSGAAALGRVFVGSRPGLRLGLAAAVAVLLAFALERRPILLAMLVSAAGLVVATGILVFPESTRFLLPTLATLREATSALRQVGQTAATEVAPALPLPPLFLAALLAVWTAAFSSHALAARARSPLLALLPPSALLAFGSLIANDGVRPLYVVTFLCAALGSLFADGVWRMRQWGPVTAWHGRTARFGAGTGARSARRVGLVCVGVALFVPWILPGFRASGLVNPQAGSTGVGISVDPIVDIRPQLQLNPPQPLFSVQATGPSYWRLLSLDLFDGLTWRASGDFSTGEPISAGDLLVDQPLSSGPDISQRFVLDRLRSAFLPAAYQPVAIDTLGEGTIRYNSAQSLLVAPAGVESGFSYAVRSRVVAPTAAQLGAITSLTPSTRFRPYLQLPAGIPPQVGEIARAITATSPTPLAKILAIQNYLRLFTYTLHPPVAKSGSQLLYFLTQSRAGYCVQFSGAMAVMLREIGIPARVVVGFTTGTPDANGSVYRVSTANAHAWPEVYFPSYGWLPFEPTPTRNNPAEQTYVSLAGAGAAGGTGACLFTGIGRRFNECLSSTPVRGGRRRGQPSPSPAGGVGTQGNPRLTGGEGGSLRHGSPWRRTVAEVAAFLAVALTLAIPIVKWVRRRRSLSERRPRELVLASYSFLAASAADVGMGRRPAETLWEYQQRLEQRIEGLPRLDRLVGLAGRAAYSDREISPAQAEGLTSTAREAARMVRRSVGPTRRVLSLFRVDVPATVMGLRLRG